MSDSTLVTGAAKSAILPLKSTVIFPLQATPACGGASCISGSGFSRR